MATTEMPRQEMNFGTLIPFFAITFALGWGILALLIFFPVETEAIFGPMGYTNPLFILAVYSPAIAGVFLVWRGCGIKGLGGFLRRLTLWRMPLVWWAFLVIGIPAAFYSRRGHQGHHQRSLPLLPLVRRPASPGHGAGHRAH